MAKRRISLWHFARRVYLLVRHTRHRATLCYWQRYREFSCDGTALSWLSPGKLILSPFDSATAFHLGYFVVAIAKFTQDLLGVFAVSWCGARHIRR